MKNTKLPKLPKQQDPNENYRQSRGAKTEASGLHLGSAQPIRSWRGGETPSRAEMYAETFRIGQQNQHKGQSMFQMLGQMQSQPGNPGYAPYTTATSKASAYFGADINDDWLASNSGLMGKGRISDTGSSFAPLSPTKSSTQEQNDSYWYSVAVEDHANTQKAQQELSQLKTKMGYWANRSDRGLSADDIVGMVNWDDYPTLKKARAGMAAGEPMAFTAPIACTDDDLYGMVWAAWNPESSTGDSFTDSVRYSLGQGTINARNDETADRMNPGSDNYNPYIVGSTMDDAAEYFGVSSFDAGWADSEAGMAAKGGSDTDRKMRAKVMDAEEFTAAAEAEADELHKWIAKRKAAGASLDAILDEEFLEKNYPHLADMAEGLDKGIPVDTTRAVDFDWRAIKAETEAAQSEEPTLEESLGELNVPAAEFDQAASAEPFGPPAPEGWSPPAIENTESDSVVSAEPYGPPAPEGWSPPSIENTETAAMTQKAADDEARAATKRAAGIMADSGTVTEQTANIVTGPDYAGALGAAERFIGQNQVGVRPVSITAANAYYMTTMSSVNAASGSQYFRLHDRMTELDERLARVDEQIAEMEAEYEENGGYYTDRMAYDSMVAARNDLLTERETVDAQLSAVADQFEAVNELRPDGVQDASILSYKEDYDDYTEGIPGFTGWDKSNHYDDAVASGMPADEVRTQMHGDYDAMAAYREYLLGMIATFEGAGMGDAKSVGNMREHVALLEEGMQQIETNMLDEREDFEAVVAGSDAALRAQLEGGKLDAKQANILYTFLDPDAVFMETSKAASWANLGNPGSVDVTDMLPPSYTISEGMSKAERKRFAYIWLTESPDAAIEYFEGLEATVNQRNTAAMSEMMYEMGNSGPLGAVLAVPLGTVMSVGKIEGVLATAAGAITGEKVDPYSSAFAVNHATGSLRAGSRDYAVGQFLAEDGSETPASQIVGFVYDAVSSGADNGLLALLTGPASLYLMSASSASDTAMDSLIRNGGEATPALFNGIATGLAEWATEKLPMDTLGDIIKGNKKGIGAAFAVAFTEAPGESLSTFLGGVSDRTFMGAYSNYERRKEQLEGEGKSPEEAENIAEKEFWREIMYSGVVGWASAGASSSIAAGANSWNQRQAYKQQMGGYSALLTKANGSKTNTQAAEAMVMLDVTHGSVGLEEAQAAVAAVAEKGMDAAKFQQILLAGRSSETAAKAMQAVATGTLAESSQAAVALNSLLEGEVTRKGVQDLVAAYDADVAGNKADAIKAQMQQAVLDFRTAAETAKALQTTDTAQVDQLTEAADTAKADKAAANRDHKAAQNKLKAAQAAFAKANQAVTQAQIPTKEALAAAKAAQQKVTEARTEVAKTREAQKAAAQKADIAVAELSRAQEMLLTEARVQAQAAVQEQLVAEEAARAEAEEQAQVAAEEANISQLSADNFLAENGYDNMPTSMQTQAAEVYRHVAEARASIPVEEAVPQNLTPDDIALRKAEAGRKRAIQFAGNLGRRFNVKVNFVDPGSPWEGKYEDGVVYLSKDATQGDAMRRIVFHEFTHRAEESGLYEELSDAVLQLKYGDNADQLKADLAEKQSRYQAQLAAMGYSQKFTEADARAEIVADAVGELLFGDEASVQKLVDTKPTLARKVMNWIQDILDKIAKLSGREIDQLRRTRDLFARALDDVTMAEAKSLKENGVELSESGTASKYSLASWTDAEKKRVRDSLRKAGFEEAEINAWMNDVNSVASIIAEQAALLDYEADPAHVALKDNQEYKRTLDFSTLCAKRLLYQGTFNEIQKMLPNTVLTSDMLIELNNMMDEAGHETPCACCYVESRRRHLGKFAKEWLDSYEGEYKPSIAEITTTDGLQRLKAEHPEAAEAFIREMNRKGSNNPKVVQLRTDYRGDIRALTKPIIETIKRIGGLRIQSFSDFETPHLIDMMQAVLDMTAKKLTSQAYTKVPNFAWVFGDTGIKINLSLLAEGDGLNPDGTLRFSSKEGMDFDEAMRLRDRYSENVGTILVGVSDDHIRAAMADPRIDYIIPFHRSGWGEHEMELMTKLRDYTDYQSSQNERRIVGYTKDGKPKYESCVGEKKGGNFYPIDYWDYSKSGDENAKTYLRLCEEDGRVPKFDQFLTKDADGHWVAPSGYWKMLIDFKMYDNDGNGAPQQTVQPKFNMDEAKRVLGEYNGDPNSLPVAWDIVEKAIGRFGDSIKAYTPSEEGKSFPAVFKAAGKDVEGKIFVVAHTSVAPAELNLPSAEVHLRGDKVKIIRKEHPAMSDDVFERVPEVIENPVFALKSKTVPGRIVLVGDLMDDNGYPVIAAISTKAKKSDSVDVEFIPLHSVYGKDSYPQEFFKTSEYVYVSKDKNRVRNWEKTARLQLPSEVIPSDSDTSISASEKKVNGSFSLPAPSVIAQQANEHQLRQLNDYNGLTPGEGQKPRQFADQTAQESPAMPDYVKQYLWNSYGEHFYDVDSNREQVERSWQRVQQNGMEAERDRLMSLDRFSADDTAEANLLMAIAFGTGDAETALGLASRYNQEGTEAGQELQARKLFSRMNPTGARIWVAGHAERKFKEWQQTHQPAVKRITADAKRVEDSIRDLQGGDDHLHLTDGSDLTIDSSNNKWGIPLNEQQQALIDHYGLEKVARPGIHYNWATTKQRMLEAILCTPNPLALTGCGMTLVERLEYMANGQAVVTNADLEYIGTQMAEFVGAGGEAGGRDANVAISRAYEAFGNITPATGREKYRSWRYTSMLWSAPSAIRNVIGNATQNTVNAGAHGLAVAFDHIVAGVTGQRSISSLTLQERIDGWRAFVDETKNTFKDYFVDRTITNPRPQERFSTHKRGREFQSGLEVLRRTESLLMSVGDRNVWRKAYVNAVAELQRVNDMNIQNGQQGMSQEELLDLAEHEANYATFNEQSDLSNILNQMKQNPHWGFLLDYIIPFTGVTTNVTKRMLQYSPFGLVNTVYRVARNAHRGENFDQRAFVQGLSRGLSSFGMIAVGALLKSLGLIKLGYKEEEDSKAKGLRKGMGEQYEAYLQLGDMNINLSTFNPASAAFVMGAAWHEEAQKVDGSLVEGALNMLFSAGDMIFESSYMTSLKDMLGVSYGSEGFTQNFVTTLLSSMVAQPVLALMQQAAKAIDPYVRDTKDSNTLLQIGKELINKIPFARELLPKSIDVMGKEELNDTQGAWNFVQPLSIKQQDNEPAAVEILRLEDVLGTSSHVPSDALSGSKTKITIGETSYTVKGKDKQFYRERYGELWLHGGITYNDKGMPIKVTGVSELMETEAYKSASDAEKAEMIEPILKAAKTGASCETAMRLSTGAEVFDENWAVFREDYEAGTEYMAMAYDVFSRTGDNAALPRPAEKFTKDKVTHEIGTDQVEFNSVYRDAYRAELELVSASWDSMTDEERLQHLNAAHSAGNKAAKKWYLDTYVNTDTE